MAAKEFSIIIPLYNKEDTIARSLGSALRQRGVTFEVIVVDDGSTDGSIGIVESFGSDVRLIRQPNAGPSAARNTGIANSLFRYCLFLDADDELLPDCLKTHNACLEANPEARVSLGSFRVIESDGTGYEEILPSRICPEDHGPALFYSTEFTPATVIGVHSGSICVDRELLRLTGGFDERLRCWEISELMFRLSLAVPVIGLHRDVSILVHRAKDNSQFQRTMQEFEYKKIFAETLLARLPEAPRKHWRAFSSPIRAAIYSAWDVGRFADFSTLARKASEYLPDINIGLRMRTMAAAPIAILAALWKWHDVYRRCLSRNRTIPTSTNH